MTIHWQHPDRFTNRHIGPNPADRTAMAAAVGYDSVDQLIDAVVPKTIRSQKAMSVPPALSEADALKELRSIASRNKVFRSYLGMGYHHTQVPPVIQRCLLENPGWYTQYTPYQAEIAQGRLEGLLNFQTVTTELTGLPIANASLLDEATAAAEAMNVAWGLKGKDDKMSFFVAHDCHPQTIDVLKTRAWPLGIHIVVGDHKSFVPSDEFFGALVQYPATDGAVYDYTEFFTQVHAGGGLAIAAADWLSLCVLKKPADMGVDMAVGNTQRFGVPLGYGGPHAAYFACSLACKRKIPGRIVGVSKDRRGETALRLSLQTREQHIRREKATSNICTAQALLANMAAAYAVYHGPQGLRAIAEYVHNCARLLAAGLEKLGYQVGPHAYFDTIRVDLQQRSGAEILECAEDHGINLRSLDSQTIGIALDETVSVQDIETLWQIFNGDQVPEFNTAMLQGNLPTVLTAMRPLDFLSQPVFTSHHSEAAMTRYLKRLENRDLSLTQSMIPLGSCTMKLNAVAEMFPVSWPEFAAIHPFAPRRQTRGYQVLFGQLEQWLAQLTGFDCVSLQPNAGSQGEYAGLLAIRAYHKSRGQGHRHICIIPTSAHGTNPASAIMAGMQVVAVRCDDNGNIDVADLRDKAATHQDDLACLMITYPSTHGVFEASIREVNQIIHHHGGQVYMDGANMNAQVGICSPGDLGADVCHLNLHKTFAIPHGGGGPGVGPICAARHLAPFMPSHSVIDVGGEHVLGGVSAAPWGSAGVLPISWMYIAMNGFAGLLEATHVAILNANYIAKRLAGSFDILYTGQNGLVAHECIIDLRSYKKSAGITEEDVAKRLIDYGFHAPTVSWPVPGTMMIEPTESESRAELDRFCDALLGIHAEITAIILGQADADDNVLKNAPHTADQVCGDSWEHSYSRDQAAYPAPWLREAKFWPSVSRIDNAYGDRNLVCSCVGMESYA